MPTPSEPVLRGEWTARTDTPKRSVFGNYRPETAPVCPPGNEASAPGASRDGGPMAREAVDQAMARSFVYRYLAQAFADPSPAGWQWLTDPGTIGTLRSAAAVAGESLRPAVELWVVAATRSARLARASTR